MTITKELEELQLLLEKYGQQHLIQFWNELSENEREILKKDIKDIDFQIFFRDLQKAAITSKRRFDAELDPPSVEQCGYWNKSSPAQLEKYNEIGLKYISNGEYCAILMAGGVGTRLGVSSPKGMYNVGLLSGKSLYQLQAERLLRLQYLAFKRFGKVSPIMWYIMTSDCNLEATVEYFRNNNYFGLKQDQVYIFEQFVLPVVGFNGKMILQSKFKISKSPDGNGGLYRALNKFKVIDDMKNRGIKYAIVHGVDNILVKIADPVFLGFCVEKRAECAAKVVEKIYPEESVGIIGKVNGSIQVLEYSEISFEAANMRDTKENKLKYRCGSICTHLFSIDFLKRICRSEINERMVQHIAIKKAPYVNIDTGLIEKPEKENVIKLEKFVFDVFPYAQNFAIWEVERNREFSPLKNSLNDKTNNAETCRNDLLKYHCQLVCDSLTDSNLQDKVKDMIIEISPLVSYSGEGLENISLLINKSEEPILHIESMDLKP